jgi:hypothetical protein
MPTVSPQPALPWSDIRPALPARRSIPPFTARTARRRSNAGPPRSREASASPPSFLRRSRTSSGSKMPTNSSTASSARWRGSGPKLALLLVQLPPSLAFDGAVVTRFFERARRASPAPFVCEPRHASWFEEPAERLLDDLQVARVAADPAKVPAAATPGGSRDRSYYRLHGSPVPYRSSYEPERLAGYAAAIACGSGGGQGRLVHLRQYGFVGRDRKRPELARNACLSASGLRHSPWRQAARPGGSGRARSIRTGP